MLAIRADTVAAAQAADAVARVVVVADRADRAAGSQPIVVQSRPGLNAALREGAAYAARHWPADGVAALVGDLPALRPHELADALARAAGHPHGFVPDAPGTGTTLLTARPARRCDPAFGPGSAARHARSAVALAAGPGLRTGRGHGRRPAGRRRPGGRPGDQNRAFPVKSACCLRSP